MSKTADSGIDEQQRQDQALDLLRIIVTCYDEYWRGQDPSDTIEAHGEAPLFVVEMARALIEAQSRAQ